MTTLNLNLLIQEQLRPVARLVFPADPLECDYLFNKNRYTRMYLRRIIQRAKKGPFNLKITKRQLARLFHLPLNKFLQWFHHNVQLPEVFSRVRYFLRQILLMNIYEDLSQLDVPEATHNNQRPLDWPNRRTMAHWRHTIKAIREEYRNRGPVIEDPVEAEELIECMQAGYYSSDSSDSDSESIGNGAEPDEEHFVNGTSSEMNESSALHGRPVILNVDQLSAQFKNIIVKSDTSGDDESSTDADHLRKQSLCFEGGCSMYNE
ncbi:unnamed protein product [Adineta steineri]|uniref:Uncharacterized protein n=1 Tax=Adineta steineri TaxID=433720 RepID=A0A819XFQ0_9BILA|nr:unnamed protein product [Adineta steineri]CAF4139635.1 unnamed protein product [Adineta steineri]